MKKIKFLSSLVMAGLALVGMTSCSDDNDSNPVITTNPTQFVVNTPAASEQYIQLSKENTVNLTWSQPNYTYNALATYKIQVGLVNSDGSYTWNTDSKTKENKFLETSYTECSADLNGEEIAWAINNLQGITTKSEFPAKDKGYQQIAMRVYSSVLDAQNVEVANSSIFSNAIVFKNMASYEAVKEKGWIYLIGQPSGWKIGDNEADVAYLDANWRLTETEIGSKIYEATFTLPANNNSFRFYTALGNWETNSMGCADDTGDNDVPCEFTNGLYEGKCAAGKGKWAFNTFAGGKVKMTVNLNTNMVNYTVVQ